MIAIVGRGPGGDPEWIDRIVTDDVDSAGLETIEKRGGRGVGAVAVVDNVDPHTLSALGKEQVAEMLAVALHILDDVAFEIDVVARAADRREHRSECRCTIAQDARAVADHEWALGDRVFDGEMVLQNIAVGSLGAQLVECRLALLRAERTARTYQLRLGTGIGGLIDHRLHVRHARTAAERAKSKLEEQSRRSAPRRRLREGDGH